VPNVVGQTRDQITLQWQIEPGYYLYRDKLGFALANAGNARIDSTALDPGIIQTDDYFGDVAVYRQTARAVLNLSPPVDGSEADLEIKYQGCADIGVCFPPKTLTLPVAFMSSLAAAEAETTVDTTKIDETDTSPVKSLAALASSSDNDTSPPASGGTGASQVVVVTAAAAGSETAPPVAISEQDFLTAKLANGSLWLNAASFFVLGLLLAFTPCVLPMIPILSSLIVGQGESMSTARAFRLSLIYVMAMALTYTIVGVLVGLSGYNIQAWFQNPWVLSVFAGLFVLLSLSMFGFYELQLPNALQNKLTNISNRQKGGSWTGVAIMGFLSALIVGPCVTAPLVGALVYIADTGNAVIGGVALFSLSLGMGAPLLLIGASAGRLLPKAGTWMNATKQIFGIMMLAMAIYMLSRFLSAEIIMGLSAVLALISGIYLGATDSIDRDSSGWSRMGKGVGLVVSLYGVALMVGAMSGNHSFITPLRGVVSAGGGAALEEESTLTFKRVKSLQELQAVVAEASAAGRPVMLDFYADWCVSCKEMVAFTFSDPAVRNELKNAILVQADVTENNDDDQALLRHFGLFGPPAIIFYGKDGEEIRPARVVGFMEAERFSEHVAGFLNHSDA
jgi:thiol:disulfide interchange protein DsbD